MSGQDGNRGYLIQSVIAILESLNNKEWQEIIIEPDNESEKVDIVWYMNGKSTATQVKSSINQINLSDAKAWAKELDDDSDADELSLTLIGPCAQKVARLGSHGRVSIPTPKSLDIDGMLGLAAHKLDRFLATENIESQSSSHRELMIKALVTEISILASHGTPFTRSDFIAQIKSWVNVSVPKESNWELVSFSNQRSIDSAIAGLRLGPADVECCPELPFVNDVIVDVMRSHWHSIIGSPGCGKSITAWHAAYRLHKEGYTIWRPHYDATPELLLNTIPSTKNSVLIVDDAQQFSLSFIDRLAEISSPNLKIIFTSTFQGKATPNPSLISPKSGVSELESSIFKRREEILPVIQRHDDRISDSYMDTSFEMRVKDAANQKSPWEFFWVLRGGWRTARTEFNNLSQIPNASYILTLIAIRQIGSCDAGIHLKDLIKLGLN